jgi:hypothetical protein
VAHDLQRVIVAESGTPVDLAAYVERAAGGRSRRRARGAIALISYWIVHADATNYGDSPAIEPTRIFYFANKDNSDILI